MRTSTAPAGAGQWPSRLPGSFFPGTTNTLKRHGFALATLCCHFASLVAGALLGGVCWCRGAPQLAPVVTWTAFGVFVHLFCYKIRWQKCQKQSMCIFCTPHCGHHGPARGHPRHAYRLNLGILPTNFVTHKCGKNAKNSLCAHCTTLGGVVAAKPSPH